MSNCIWTERHFHADRPALLIIPTMLRQIIDQMPCNGKYFFGNPLKFTILANGWEWRWGSWEFNSILTKELSKQLAKFPHVKVTVLVPEGSFGEIEKRNAESHNVTIVEAKKPPGFQDPNDWLYFPPKGLTTHIVIGVGDRLCRMAQTFKEHHCCKSIFRCNMYFGPNTLKILKSFCPNAQGLLRLRRVDK